MKEFTNEGRTRYYGLRIGDKVVERHDGLSDMVGTVVEFDGFDNNRVHVQLPSGKIVPCVAEWLEVAEKIEDIQKKEKEQK